MQSLFNILTVFKKSGTNPGGEGMVAQAPCQNVKASVALPMRALEWAGMILRIVVSCLGRRRHEHMSSYSVSLVHR